MNRDIIKDGMRKADMLEAAFVGQFEHGVNKTAFLFFCKNKFIIDDTDEKEGVI